MLLEFKLDGIAELTFYRNGTSLGKAFESIPQGIYYPCVSLMNNEETDVQVTLNPHCKKPK